MCRLHCLLTAVRSLWKMSRVWCSHLPRFLPAGTRRQPPTDAPASLRTSSSATSSAASWATSSPFRPTVLSETSVWAGPEMPRPIPAQESTMPTPRTSTGSGWWHSAPTRASAATRRCPAESALRYLPTTALMTSRLQTAPPGALQSVRCPGRCTASTGTSRSSART